ncbi:DUF6542 domain-containing protein [Kitasatospora cineracea]|uniref:DUF6542 domain-containing protein n=1 Tax=Kitasatospora cineracea TaxID=88074 RepID=A0A8G1UMS9_9ACTN|nr:DUF6542 domain-containing protein [Kitasatospora cineracea]ROR46831.1 hypothetical protein EDD39_5122 [Kitasatospora cineracea]
MTGRRPTGTRGDAPLWRDEPGTQDHADGPGAQKGPGGRPGRREAAARPVPAQRAPHRERRRAPDDPAPARRPAPRRGNRMPAVLPALGLPVLGAIADELLTPGPGAPYGVCAVLGAALAALVSTPAGWWWVVSGAPVVTLAAAGGVDYLARGDKYHGAGLGTEGLKLVSGQFPWMLAALAAALLAVGVRKLRTRRSRRG